jgi:hypothetical protein
MLFIVSTGGGPISEGRDVIFEPTGKAAPPRGGITGPITWSWGERNIRPPVRRRKTLTSSFQVNPSDPATIGNDDQKEQQKEKQPPAMHYCDIELQF